MDNVVLFPNSIEYYQKELTKLLEGERYAEAADMLRFLLQCQSDDPQYKEEWQSLLKWLNDAFPETAVPAAGKKPRHSEGDGDEDQDQDDEPENEGELFKRHVQLKTANDSKYAEKLLDMLSPRSPADKQLLALEQLAHVDRRVVAQPLRQWLTESRLHPLVQFRGLQVLRQIGESGLIQVQKLGQTLTLDIRQTPLRYEQFPDRIRDVLVRCRERMEAEGPGLLDMAECVWRDFIGFLYGTTVYEELLRLEGTGGDVWAAALHYTVQETLFGGADIGAITALYRLAPEDSKALAKAQQIMKLFATVAAPGDS
ncbi:hypothetical protein D7M11_16990 [Paenibacillus ginsengarvi]|uniref:Uncharacterized protein n=2 Tax=Paenibacillus ginsengarvi TaxID=400777 RepID=A0A3B0CDE2_9BACL|nr:hypothetical protein D7M11_16990 [Paenibacillus ginsengarvi]